MQLVTKSRCYRIFAQHNIADVQRKTHLKLHLSCHALRLVLLEQRDETTQLCSHRLTDKHERSRQPWARTEQTKPRSMRRLWQKQEARKSTFAACGSASDPLDRGGALNTCAGRIAGESRVRGRFTMLPPAAQAV